MIAICRFLSALVLLPMLTPRASAEVADPNGPTFSISRHDAAEATGARGCEQDLTAILDNDNPALGETITFTVTVTNNAAAPASLDLWIHASGQHTNLIKHLGSGTVPANATVTQDVRVRIPGGPTWLAGNWLTHLRIGDFDQWPGGGVCDIESFHMQVTPPAGRDADPMATAFVSLAPEGDLFAASPAAAPTLAVSPNPFANRTALTFVLPEAADVRLAVYDVLGREVAVVVDEAREAGTHTAPFDASALAAGTYVYRLQVGGGVRTGRLSVVR